MVGAHETGTRYGRPHGRKAGKPVDTSGGVHILPSTYGAVSKKWASSGWIMLMPLLNSHDLLSRPPHLFARQVADQRPTIMPVTFALMTLLLREHNRCCDERSTVWDADTDEVWQSEDFLCLIRPNHVMLVLQWTYNWCYYRVAVISAVWWHISVWRCDDVVARRDAFLTARVLLVRVRVSDAAITTKTLLWC